MDYNVIVMIIFGVALVIFGIGYMAIKSKDGKDMLLYQAVLAFNLFYSNKFNTDKITKLMHKAFEL